MRSNAAPAITTAVVAAATVAATAFLSPYGAALADRMPESPRPSQLDRLRRIEAHTTAVVDRTIPAVVFIGGGSGVCIGEGGLILTNDHVVGERSVVLVRFAITGERHRARLLGRFPTGDISLLQIEDEGKYPHLELGDSDALRPGERVMAIGNPFLLAVENGFFPGAPADYLPSISLGVVSAMHRNSPPRYPDAIQVDVAVNPGNSGGPLVNSRGEVVGINGKIETRFHLSVNSGVGYAIPSNQIARFLEPLRRAKGKVIGHGRLVGVEIEERSGTAAAGVTVKRVAGNSPAALAGLRRGDRITAIDDYPIPTRLRFDGLMQTYPVNTRVTISVLRDGESREIVATLVDPRSDRPVKLGVRFDAEEQVKGHLRIAVVHPGSPADRAGLKPGDVVLRFDNSPVGSFVELATRIRGHKAGDVVIVRVRRDGKDLDIPILLQSFETP